MFRKLLITLALLLFGFAAGLAVCESVLRFLAPQQEVPRWFEADERYAYRLKPDFHQDLRFVGSDFVMEVRTNSLGLRDEEPGSPEPGAGKTVLFLGDSFVFGYGVNVPERFDTLLARLLRDAGKHYRLINAGVPGWGTIQETRYARDHFALLQPDSIVLTFCGNDPMDDSQFLAGEMVFRERGMGGFPGKDWLRAHSHLYRFVLYQTTVLRRNLLLRDRQKQDGAVHVDAQSAGILDDALWERTFTVIREFHGEFLDFNPDGRLFVMATNPEDERIRARLQSLDNGANLRYLDLYDAVTAIPPEERMLPYDRHWGREVHKAVAAELYRALEGLE